MGRMAEPAAIAAAIGGLLRPGGPLDRPQHPRDRRAARASRSIRCASSATAARAGWVPRSPTRLRGAARACVAVVGERERCVPSASRWSRVETAAELEREALAPCPAADVVLMAAAVADYRPVESLGAKRRREGAWSLELEPTNDILAAIGAARRPGQVLVGFAAETGADGLERARGKLARKGLDLIVLNDVSRSDIGFDSPDNEVVLVSRDGEETVAKAGKAEIAGRILDRVETLLS